MKVFIGAVLIIIILIVATFSLVAEVKETCEMVLTSADALEKSILERNGENARGILSEIQTEWNKRQPLLMAFTDHAELNMINERLTNIKSGLLYEDYPMMYKELAVLKEQVKYVVKSAYPTPTNIL